MKTKLIVAVTLIMSVFCSAQEEIYVSKQNGLFRMVNLSCPVIYIGYTTLGSTTKMLTDIALTPNGTLWGIDEENLYLVNKQTGALTLVYAYAYSSASLLALDDSNLLLIANHPDTNQQSLLKLNTTTFQITNLGMVNYFATGDLVFFDGELYFPTYGRMVKINMNDDFSMVESVQLLSPYLPNYIKFFGLVTISDPQYSGNYIYGFSQGHQVYRICPIDGSIEYVCQTTVAIMNDFLGATATEVPIQNPVATSCPTLSNSNFSFGNFKATFQPNPIKKGDDIEIKFSDFVNSEAEVKIFDLHGSLLVYQIQKLVNQNQMSVDLSRYTLQTGVYVIQVEAEGNKDYLKLIVN